MVSKKKKEASRSNGSKGGRPVGSVSIVKKVGRPSEKTRFRIRIRASETASAIKKNDLGAAIGAAIARVLPRHNVVIQTKQRLQNANIPFDPTGVHNLIEIDGQPIKFNWELNHYVTNFAILTQGTRDFVFNLEIPKEVLS